MAENTAVSVSVDQRLKLWKIDWNSEVYIHNQFSLLLLLLLSLLFIIIIIKNFL